jgi:uncharacterized protein
MFSVLFRKFKFQMDLAVINKITEIVHGFLPDARILLFGSQARGDFDEQSDFDLLIITPEKFDFDTKLEFRSMIHENLVKSIHKPFDLLMHSEDEVQKSKNLPGHIIKYALAEGILI